MGEPEDPHRLMNACPNCGEVIDVSACAPFSKVLCPSCSGPIRVRGDFLHFKIQKKIGEGGMSRVFRATDQTLSRQVALKILNPNFSKDAKRAEEFEREAKITASINHPNVVKVYSAGKDQEHYFIAMELVGGGSLDEKITAEGAIPEARVLEVAYELVQGLNAAHEAGLIHRDMKPGNVLFSEKGMSKIVDFGLALMLEHADQDDGEIWATPYYVPPEKLYKEPEDFRSDIYSLGATLFHALAGKPPYSADTSSIEELKAIKEKPISLEMSAPNVSMTTCELIDRMMARRPEMRYASYAELLDHVGFARQKLLEHGGVETVAATATMRRKVREKKALTASLVALVIGVLALGGILGFHFLNRNRDVAGGNGGGGDGGGNGGNGGSGFVVPEGESTTEKFEDARKMLVKGRFKPAGTAFGEIATAPGTKQPTANWALFNQGLSLLFQGKSAAARGLYARLEADSEYSDNERDAQLVAFFNRVGDQLSSPLPVLPNHSDSFRKDTSEALALLACGLKNWEMGALAAAQIYFRAFRDAKPREGEEWVSEFKPLINPYLHDLDKLQRFPALNRTANYQQARAALKTSEEVYGELKMGGLKLRIEKRIERLKRAVARLKVQAEEEETKRLAQLKVSEGRRMTELLRSLEPFRDGLRFSEGIELLEAKAFERPDYVQRYQDELYLWKGAEAFVTTLISDINRFGYTGPVEQLTGSIRTLNVVSADRERLTYSFGGTGEAKIPLAQVTERSLLDMGDRMSSNFPEMAAYLPRREGRAVFAYVVGDKVTAKRASVEVKNPVFQKIWKRIEAREGDSS